MQTLWFTNARSLTICLPSSEFPQRYLDVTLGTFKPAQASHRPKESMVAVLFPSHWQDFVTFWILHNCRETNCCHVSILHDFFTARGGAQADKQLGSTLYTNRVKVTFWTSQEKALEIILKRCWVEADKFSWFLLLKWQFSYAIRK